MSAHRHADRRGALAPRTGRGLLGYLPALAVLVLAAGLGWGAARHLTSRAPLPPPATTTLVSGPVRLVVGSPWAPATPPALPGLRAARAWTPFAGLRMTVSQALLARDAALPALAQLAHAARGGLGRPRTARLTGLAVREYPGVLVSRLRADIYLLQLTNGVLALTCTRPAHGPDPTEPCLDALESIAVAGARPVSPARALPLGAAATTALRALNRDRSRARAALARARTPRAQAAAAARLSRAHTIAAARVAPLVPVSAVATTLTAVLRQTSAAYGRLSRAGRSGDSRGWLRARRGVAAAERRLRQVLRATPA
jgi:hypothetical protein